MCKTDTVNTSMNIRDVFFNWFYVARWFDVARSEWGERKWKGTALDKLQIYCLIYTSHIIEHIKSCPANQSVEKDENLKRQGKPKYINIMKGSIIFKI